MAAAVSEAVQRQEPMRLSELLLLLLPLSLPSRKRRG